MFAWCKSKRIDNIQYLTAQTRHALREDSTSPARVRADATPGESLSWSIDEGPKPDYVAAFKAMKKARGAGERKGSQLGLHMLVGVSPDWVREAGDIHDADNPRNKALLDAAREWADSWSGGGCYAARLDLDETGGAVIDLFIAPLAEQRHKSGKSKLVVSVNKALEAVALEYTNTKGRHYSALNSSWAEYAKAHLDPRLKRGRPKSETGVEHIPPDKYRKMMEEAEAAQEKAKEAEARAAAALAAVEAFAAELSAGTLTEREGRLVAADSAPFRASPDVWKRLAPVARAIIGARKDAAGLVAKLRDWMASPALPPSLRPSGETLMREVGQEPPKVKAGDSGKRRMVGLDRPRAESPVPQQSPPEADSAGPSM